MATINATGAVTPGQWDRLTEAAARIAVGHPEWTVTVEPAGGAVRTIAGGRVTARERVRRAGARVRRYVRWGVQR